MKRRSITRRWLLALGIFVGLLILALEAKTQTHSLFIYGEVYTVDGDKYEGVIKWTGNNGSDEVYWVETFNGLKTNNDFLKLLSAEERESLSNAGKKSGISINIGSLSIWEDRNRSKSSYRFDVQFGDISSITPLDTKKARIKLKNDFEFEVSGDGYEDVGGTINVHDYELGDVSIKWSRIKNIIFKDTPALDKKYGDPIYGKINAGRKGSFSGIIQWDKHERFLDEVLDGKSRNEDMKIPFKSISRIERGRGRDGVEVWLNSGRNLYLEGTNDVNSSNKGIVIYNQDLGKVTISWRDFIDFEIVSSPAYSISYNQFEPSPKIRATIKTINREEYSGSIIYNLNKNEGSEILSGKDDDVLYEIPLKKIKRIIPKNYSYSLVILKNGAELLLGGTKDLSESNDGVLIFTSGSSEPVYIEWSKIEEITFD